MISDRLKKLIEQAEQSKEAEEFWKEIEREASRLEIPVDYFLAEFY